MLRKGLQWAQGGKDGLSVEELLLGVARLQTVFRYTPSAGYGTVRREHYLHED